MFSIHGKAHSVDWKLVNKSKLPQPYRVTIYNVDGNEREIIRPGPLAGSVEPLGIRHNANSVGKDKPFQRSHRYEIIIEINSTTVKPQVEMWSGNWAATMIPETIIPARKFRLLRK